MTLDQIEALAEVLERVPRLTEIDIRAEGSSLRLRRGGIAVASPTAPAAASATVAELSPSELPEPIRERAAFVGVFHAGEPPIAEGDMVREGQVLGQIETMRIDNDCTAAARGRIVAVYVRNAQPVEYGQPLFDIDPEAP